MNKNLLGLFLVLVAVWGMYYLATSKSLTSTNVQAPSVPMTTPSVALSSAVAIQNFSFIPASLTVKTGTKVVWTNSDSVSHTVTSDVGGILDSSTIAPGQSFSFTFTKSGSVAYHCAIHPGMKGTVTVEN